MSTFVFGIEPSRRQRHPVALYRLFLHVEGKPSKEFLDFLHERRCGPNRSQRWLDEYK